MFNNPASLGTGLLPKDFPQGQVKYVELDLKRMQGRFAPGINVPLSPFQGHWASPRRRGFSRRSAPASPARVPPGPHGGNLDLKELTEGSALYLPVWKPGRS